MEKCIPLELVNKMSEVEKRDVILHKIFTNLNNGGI